MTEASTVSNPQFVAPAIQISVELIQTVRSHRLTSAEYALWFYLYEVAPSGEYINIPAPHEVAALLNVNPRTIERAAQRLEDLNLFSFQLLSDCQGRIWRTRNEQATVQKTPPPPPPDNDKGMPPPTNGSKTTKNDLFVQPSKPRPSKGFKKFSTAELVPEQIHLNLNKETDLVETKTSVPSRLDQEGIGTKFDEICKYIRENGFDPNPAIRATLSKLSTTLDAFDFRKRIENAISAVQEQIRKGNLKKPTPEPLLNQALIRGFTSNEEKKLEPDAKPKPLKSKPRKLLALPPFPKPHPEKFSLLWLWRQQPPRAASQIPQGSRCLCHLNRLPLPLHKSTSFTSPSPLTKP